MPAEPADHAVGGPLVLHLHHGPLVGLVAEVTVLDHDAVQPGALEPREPVPGHLRPGGDRGEMDRGPGRAERLLEGPAADGVGLGLQIGVAEGQEVEGHERGRRGPGQQLDP